MSDYDHQDDDWVEEPEYLDDESLSDDPDLDAVDTYGFLEEQRRAAAMVRRHRARDARREMFTLSRHDVPIEVPLTTSKKEKIMYPTQHPQQYPPVEGLDGPFQDPNSGTIYYIDRRNGQTVDAQYVVGQLRAQSRPQPPAPHYPQGQPQGYPQPYGQPGYPQPSYGAPGGRPMQPMQPNTAIYGQSQSPYSAPAPAVDASADFDRVQQLKRRQQGQVEAPDHSGHRIMPPPQPTAMYAAPDWDNAPVVETDVSRSQDCLYVCSETLAALQFDGIKVPVTYNHKTRIALPLADADGNLVDCLINREGIEVMDKLNHAVQYDQVTLVDNVLAEAVKVAVPEVAESEVALHRAGPLEGTSLEQSLVMSRRICAERGFTPTLVPFTNDVSICIFPEGVSDESGEVAEGLIELTTATESGSFSEWVKAFKSLYPTLSDNDMQAAARYLNRKATRLSNDILMRVMQEDVELTEGFNLDIDQLVHWLKNQDLYLEFAEVFMANIGYEVKMEVGDLNVEGKEYAVLLSAEAGRILVTGADVTLQDGDKGICHPMNVGQVTGSEAEELYEACRLYAAATRDDNELPLYVYATSTEGGWVKLARSCSSMAAMDTYYVVDSGC